MPRGRQFHGRRRKKRGGNALPATGRVRPDNTTATAPPRTIPPRSVNMTARAHPRQHDGSRPSPTTRRLAPPRQHDGSRPTAGATARERQPRQGAEGREAATPAAPRRRGRNKAGAKRRGAKRPPRPPRPRGRDPQGGRNPRSTRRPTAGAPPPQDTTQDGTKTKPRWVYMLRDDE